MKLLSTRMLLGWLSCGLHLALWDMQAHAATLPALPPGATNRLLRSASWQIYYREIPATWWRVTHAHFWVRPDQGDVDHGLRLDIVLGFSRNSDWAGFPQGQVRASLHHSAPLVTEPSDASLLGAPVPATISEGSLASVMCWFPWASNALEEAFLNVRLGEKSYGLELPYGFTLDPRNQQRTPTEPTPEKLRKALLLPEGTQRVPWTSINWDLGEIEDNCRLLLLVSNRVETAVQMTLYRDQSRNWDLETPECSVSITDADGTPLHGTRVARDRPDTLRRVDTYDFGRVSTKATTGWGSILLTVGQARYTLVVPRSVYSHAP